MGMVSIVSQISANVHIFIMRGWICCWKILKVALKLSTMNIVGFQVGEHCFGNSHAYIEVRFASLYGLV
jgi:hypothetical protein